jgi:hypothetical protein
MPLPDQLLKGVHGSLFKYSTSLWQSDLCDAGEERGLSSGEENRELEACKIQRVVDSVTLSGMIISQGHSSEKMENERTHIYLRINRQMTPFKEHPDALL